MQDIDINLDSIVDGTDSYKLGHHGMDLPGTEYSIAYFEARKGAKFDETTFVGLQYLLKQYFLRPITKEDIDFAEQLTKEHMGADFNFDRARWDYIVEKHGGRLPILIEAVPEGTVVSIDNVLMQVRNTDPKCAWLTNHCETILTHVWYGSTVATFSREVKKFLMKELEISSDFGAEFPGINFMLHDFGMRGASSMETAGIGGLAHLVNFMGTDTVIALKYAKAFYGAKTAVGFSVYATEHSIMTQAAKEGEESVVEHILDTYPKGILSIVSDSYGYENCVDYIYGVKFKDKILAREGKTVVRPDSGDPLKLMPWTLESLGKNFGYTTNNKGYKVLNPKVGVIWGDGIDFDMLKQIVVVCREAGWSAENLVFGMGGGLLQKVNRDNQRFAFKACAKMRNGKWLEVYKDPTDKTKASKRGEQKLVKIDGKFKTVNFYDPRYTDLPNELVRVYKDGELLKNYTFDEVRANTKNTM